MPTKPNIFSTYLSTEANSSLELLLREHPPVDKCASDVTSRQVVSRRFGVSTS